MTDYSSNPVERLIAGLMGSLGWTWKLRGESVIPDKDLIRKNLDGMKKAMYSDEPGTQMMLGRIIVIKRAPGKFDVYLMVGEDNDTDV